MRTVILFALSLISVVACSKFDDSAIWDELNKHEDRIVKLETLCNQMNTNIASLQTIIIALQSNDYVVNIAPIMEGSKEIGYTITFAKNGSITIYHGKDGQDGQDGYAPKIGIKQHADGKYYWTLDGNWLLDDNGHMIPTTGEDGKDGENGIHGVNGQDGITPKFKIEEDYWYISYDNGVTWEKLGKASGTNGLNGEDGDSFFKGVSMSDGFVQFTLNDENGSVIKVPYLMEDTLVFVSEKPGDVKIKLTNQQKRSVVHLIIEGYIEAADVRYIADQMLSLEILDLRKSNLRSVPAYAFCKGEVKYGKETIRKIYLPDCCTSVGESAFYGCTNLEYIEAKGDIKFASSCFSYCENLSLRIGSSTFLGATKSPETNIDTLILCGSTISNIENLRVNHVLVEKSVESIAEVTTGNFEELYINTIEFEEPSSIPTVNIGIFRAGKLSTITFPTSVKEIESHDLYSLAHAYSLKRLVVPEESELSQWELYPYYMDQIEEIYCYKPIPPTLKWEGADRISPTVYVPIENYSAYANAPIWNTFTIKTIM